MTNSAVNRSLQRWTCGRLSQKDIHTYYKKEGKCHICHMSNVSRTNCNSSEQIKATISLPSPDPLSLYNDIQDLHKVMTEEEDKSKRRLNSEVQWSSTASSNPQGPHAIQNVLIESRRDLMSCSFIWLFICNGIVSANINICMLCFLKKHSKI